MKKRVNNKKKTKLKLKYKNIFVFLLGLVFVVYLLFFVLNLPITNIYISGNTILKDQEIIEMAGLKNYPSTFKSNSFIIRNKLEDNSMIISAKVSKKWLTKVYIEIEENRPLFYDGNTQKIVMYDKTELVGNVITPYLLNYIPDTIYDEFLTKMTEINVEVLNRISEIEYNPNDVDKERFYLSMNDGNYVYLTLNSFTKINNYISMIKQFENKKGILYLDSGEYFQIK